MHVSLPFNCCTINYCRFATDVVNFTYSYVNMYNWWCSQQVWWHRHEVRGTIYQGGINKMNSVINRRDIYSPSSFIHSVRHYFVGYAKFPNFMWFNEFSIFPKWLIRHEVSESRRLFENNRIMIWRCLQIVNKSNLIVVTIVNDSLIHSWA